MARYLIGIDLGTTNCALAYVDLEEGVADGKPKLHAFDVPQLVAVGDLKDRPLLPSFHYQPGEHDLPPGSAALPWDTERDYIVGEFARVQGSRVPGRLAHSAKSWLCHAGVDRTTGLLPWSAPPEVPRLSPVEVSTRYLVHLIETWNEKMAKGKEQHRLQNLPVVLTVPASFDDVARTLTVQAAEKAGLKKVVLLEEPQAAFYCWIANSPPAEVGTLEPGARCVVIDVGGGTSDFSLIEAVEEKGEIGFVRQAVGDHLLLGGDNMDLALAKFAEGKLNTSKLDATQYSMLTQACRAGKEALLGPSPPESHRVTVVGRGRKLIGGTLHTELVPEDVQRVLFEGFFPKVGIEARPEKVARTGLHEMGLPFVSDPAITRHLAAFLAEQSHGVEHPPTAILFNGGVFQPSSLREHVVEVMRSWYAKPDTPWEPLVLTTPSLDLAVAMGSAYFGWLRHTGGKRIGGGVARSYYIGVDTSVSLDEESETPSGLSADVLCVVPQHLEEEEAISLDQLDLELALGEPVLFPLFSSTVRGADKAGELLKIHPDRLLTLPPLHTILRGGKRAGVKRVPVGLESRITAIGTLELFCVAKEGDNRWRLEFNLRDLIKEPSRSAPSEENEPTLTDVWVESQVEEASRLIRWVYTGEGGAEGEDKPKPRDLTKHLEDSLEASRESWPTGLCRRLWDTLSEVMEQRHQSPAHQSRWYNLVGWCLRPGFGDPLDKFRVEQLWKQLFAPAKDARSRTIDGGAGYWIMWRRISAGLNASYQQTLFDRLRGSLLGKGKGAKPNANEFAEIWRAASSLERLDVNLKGMLGETVLKALKRSPVPTHGFWSLTRLGARSLIYGPLNAVVHRQTVEDWLDQILSFDPGNESELRAWCFCLAQLARKTGQRALDVDDSHRKSVLTILRAQDVPDHWHTMVQDVVELDSDEQGQMLGDALPIGLRLASSG